MTESIQENVESLSDQQAIVACRSLIVLLDLELEEDPAVQRPPDVGTQEPAQLVQQSPSAQALASALSAEGVAQEEIAAAARSMLLLCAEMGYETQVAEACEAARTHVRDLGVLSGPLIVAALAAVVAWVPVEQKKKVKRQIWTTPDGGETISEEEESETKRVGAAVFQHLGEWWAKVAGGAV